MDFVNDIDRDEIRSGFLVKSDRKKLWNVMLGCYNEFRRTCEKYNIRFFADGGTLLGAVRHRGFIPWDDDMDFSMLRPDYERFKEVARNEITYPYFCDIWYENEGIEEYATATTAGTAIRIHDERTTAFYDVMQKTKQHHQGILIDILPMDSCPPPDGVLNSDPKKDEHQRKFEVLFDMRQSCLMRDHKFEAVFQHGEKTAIPKDLLLKFLNLPLKEKGALFENYCLSCFYDSQYLTYNFYGQRFKKESFRDVVYLPFENTIMPCPIGYDEFLTELYNDWHEIRIDDPTQYFFSVDFSYKDILEKCKYVPRN